MEIWGHWGDIWGHVGDIWGHVGDTHPLRDEGAEARQHLVQPGVGGDALQGLLGGEGDIWGHLGTSPWGTTWDGGRGDGEM